MSGFGVKIGVAGLSLVCGLATFSTLLPSAPGYVGSLQAAFVLAFVALGLEPMLGLLSATAAQLLLFGSVTVVGVFHVVYGHVQERCLPHLAERAWRVTGAVIQRRLNLRLSARKIIAGPR